MSDNVENGGSFAIREFTRAEHDTRKEVIPPTDKIRLLIIGRTGVGKSTLVSRVFGIPEAKVRGFSKPFSNYKLIMNCAQARVSHDTPGQHDIDKGITYDENQGIVVHDTTGFEGGEDSAPNLVKEFIRNRRAERFVKDQIHCIW
jgi:predicted GTPase